MVVHGCTLLYLAVPGCTWLQVAIPGCIWLFLAVPGCTWLFLAVPGCFSSSYSTFILSFPLNLHFTCPDSFLCHPIILLSFHHSEVSPMPFTHSVVIPSFQNHSDTIPSFPCHPIILESFHFHSCHSTVIQSFPHHLPSFVHHSLSPLCPCPKVKTFFLQPAVRLG